MNPPDIGSITTLVDLELKRLEESRREQGWTPWILLAALAALCWQLAGYVSTAHNWNAVGLYWSLLVIAGLTLESVVQGLNSGQAPRRPGIRYFRSNLFSAGRSARLFAGMKIGAAAVLLCWLGTLSAPVRFALIGVFGFFVYLLFAHVAGSWMDYAHPVGTAGKETKHGWVVTALFWAVFLASVASAMVEVWPRLRESHEANDARVALLIFAVTHLVGLLLAFRVSEPLRRELIHLRRSIGLGEVDAAEARQMLFELLHGSELSVLLRARFEAAERSLEAFAAKHADAVAAVEAAAARPEALAEAKARTAEAAEHFDSAEGDWISLHVQILIARIAGGVPDDVSRRAATLKTQVEGGEKSLKELRTRVKNTPSLSEGLP